MSLMVTVVLVTRIVPPALTERRATVNVSTAGSSVVVSAVGVTPNVPELSVTTTVPSVVVKSPALVSIVQ